ncbi:hypothetical protein ACFSTI_20110 [Rhizorhabdus histidinilytica]
MPRHLPQAGRRGRVYAWRPETACSGPPVARFGRLLAGRRAERAVGGARQRRRRFPQLPDPFLGADGSARRTRARGPFDINCPVAGSGRWSDQQSYSYEFAAPLPGGSRCTLTLRSGLAGLDGTPLVGERSAYVLDSSGPDARAVLPARYGGSIQQDQTFLIATNVPADRASIASEAYCAVDGIGEKLPVDVLPADVPRKLVEGLPNNYQLSNFLEEAGLTIERARAPGGLRNLVALRCRRPLPPGRDMALVWPNTISGGGRTALETRRFDYRVIDEFTARFECTRTNPRAGCNPVEPAYVRFTAPVPRGTAAAVRIRLPDGTSIAPAGFDDGDEGATPRPPCKA